LHHKQYLGVQTHFVTAETVCDDTGEEAKNNGGNLPGECGEPQHERGLRQAVHQPSQSHSLHPKACARDELADKEDAEIAVA
jgi:hypothetical protein